jgi:hypothetical protein
MTVRVNLGGGNFADLEPELYEVDAELLAPLRPADEDKAGGRNTLTRFADADRCTEARDD